MTRWMMGVLFFGNAALGQTAAVSQDSPTPLAPAQWIADAQALGLPPTARPFPLLRKMFLVSLTSPVVQATLTATALGSYQATVNGQAVSQAVLTPDWTNYRFRVYYQTYDVTPLVRPGANAIGVMLGEGWFGSPMADVPAYSFLPPPVRFMGVLRVTHADGTIETIASDDSWKATAGPISFSQIYDGETYDARRLPAGWDEPTFDDSTWSRVAILPAPPGVAVVPQIDPTIERITTIAPVRHLPGGADTTYYDLGQNMVGWVRVHVHGHAGDTVRLRHAEMLAPDSAHIRTGNLRTAAATDRYTLAGSGEEVFEPHFTYHGFQYVEIVTSPGVRIDSVVGVVVRTAARETITFESSDPKVTRLWENAQWSLRGNLMSVPTDCPQRSERMGWLGDAAAFWPTGVYFMDLQMFTRKWLQDLRDSQDEIGSGCFPAVSPTRDDCGGPGWSEAGVLVPYAAYRQYGDSSMVRAQWAAMERYMTYIADSNANALWQHRTDIDPGDPDFAQGFQDWAAPQPVEHTGPTLLATAFWAADAVAMHDMARALGDTAAARRYAQLHDRIRAAFDSAYISRDGVVGERIPGNASWLTSQTNDVLALRYGLVPDSLRAKVARHLVADIAAHSGHLMTGFVGAPRLLPALSDQGQDAQAYALLLTETEPSWLHEVDQGATTMWEYWNADMPVGIDRASRNHYLFGSVAEWLIHYAAGIGQDSNSVAFQHIVIHPHLDPEHRLTHLAIRYESLGGVIASGWTIVPSTGAVTLTVTIPSHHTARVDVPLRSGSGYRYVTHTVGSGTHTFTG